MARYLNKQALLAHKWKSIASWNDLNDTLINNLDSKIQSKSDKLSFWLETFSQYQLDENTFHPEWRPRYKRGDIIKVDFGFNVGREYGGLHYAVVISNRVYRTSDVLTVIPLTSKKGKPVHRDDVDLGEEIYNKLYTKYLEKFEQAIQDAAKTIEVTSIDKQKILISLRINEKPANKIMDEIKGMKKGSIALVSQITTISKMRIHDPKNTNDILYGISLSSESLDKLNAKLKDLYIF